MQKQSRILNYIEPRSTYNNGAIYSIATWRQKVLARDKKECQCCNNSIEDLHMKRKAKNEAHHVVPRHHGGKNTLSNGITLCTFCHDYFDYRYFFHGLDYFEVQKFQEKEHTIIEVKQMMKIAYINNLRFLAGN